MGKGYVEVHGKIIGRGTWKKLWINYMGKAYLLSLEKCNDEMTTHRNSKLKA